MTKAMAAATADFSAIDGQPLVGPGGSEASSSADDSSQGAAQLVDAPLPRSVPRQYLDPPAAWNPSVGLFIGGYALAALTIYGWFVGQWPPVAIAVAGFPGPASGGHGDPRRLP